MGGLWYGGIVELFLIFVSNRREELGTHELTEKPQPHTEKEQESPQPHAEKEHTEEGASTRKRRCHTPTHDLDHHKRARASPELSICFQEEEVKTNISPDITDTAPEQFNFPLISIPAAPTPTLDTTSEDWFLPNSPPCEFEDCLPDLTNDFIGTSCAVEVAGSQSPIATDINLLENSDTCTSEELWSLITTEEL